MVKAEMISNDDNQIINDTFLPGELARVANLGYYNTGDIDNDGFITVADMGLLVDHILGVIDMTDDYGDEADNRADTTGDSMLNVTDIIRMVNSVLSGEIVEGNPPPQTEEEGNNEE